MRCNRLKFRAWDHDHYAYFEVGDSFQTYSELIEQCTGLEDNKGHPVYEGDIVRYGHRDWTAEVEWANGAFQINHCYEYTLLSDWHGDFTVIGNIHAKHEDAQ